MNVLYNYVENERCSLEIKTERFGEVEKSIGKGTVFGYEKRRQKRKRKKQIKKEIHVGSGPGLVG